MRSLTCFLLFGGPASAGAHVVKEVSEEDCLDVYSRFYIFMLPLLYFHFSAANTIITFFSSDSCHFLSHNLHYLAFLPLLNTRPLSRKIIFHFFVCDNWTCTLLSSFKFEGWLANLRRLRYRHIALFHVGVHLYLKLMSFLRLGALSISKPASSLPSWVDSKFASAQLNVIEVLKKVRSSWLDLQRSALSSRQH